MHITKIELEDIKSHAAAEYEFERGTTAITGANGAGKTTLIEAVAWTLFDLLDYKKDDFVRRGVKKGTVNVTFESGLDKRQYRVYRDTGTGYYVYDPQLKIRLADKKDEVTRFLRQHLGVEAGTDLEALFRRAIGVPQGTFTAIFLETPTERKKAFDKLLKVEEYRQGAEKLRETARFVETQIVAVREKIARAEGELARFEQTEEEHKIYALQAEELSASAENLTKEAAEKSETVKKLDETESRVNELKIAFERLQTEKSKAEFLLKQKETERGAAQKAREKIEIVEADYNAHISALARLNELERERIERDKIRAEMSKVETAQINVKAEEKKYRENLEAALKAHQEIGALEPQAKRQEDLESERDLLGKEIAKTDAIKERIESLEKKLANLRTLHTENLKQIKEAEDNSRDADAFESLQKREGEITDGLAKLRARLEADEKFQSEIKNGLCPILSEKCLNLREGQTLESFTRNRFTEVKSEITTLETERKTLSVSLQTARSAEKSAATLPNLLHRREEIKTEGKSLREEQDALKKTLDDLPQIEAKQIKVRADIAALGDPRTTLKIKKQEAEREPQIREKLAEIERNLERLESDRRIFVEQLETYKDLDANWTQFSGQRDRTANAHREFLANENLAKSLPEREKDFEAAQIEFSRVQEELNEAETKFETVNKDYDRERHASEKFALAEIEKRLTEIRANLENVKKREAQLAGELKRMAEIRVSMREEFREKERLEKIGEATAFIRETLKEAAPRVARNYVFHVSIEANQMFREITGNAERTLKWTEDYGIVLEENGYDRPFQSLSGGEQMAAALSVRLAILMQLSDVRLAFFDEPTTNMDAERRERLAEQISQITKKQIGGKPIFDQLFIISHDDTFHGYFDHEIIVDKNGELTEAV